MRWSFYDEIIEIEYGKKITALKNFSVDDDFFHDHFPGFPVVPGVIQIEAMAQVAGRLIAISQHQLIEKKVPILPLLSMVERAVFRKVVTAGQKLTLKAEILTMTPEMATVNGKLYYEKDVAARAKLFFSIFYGDQPGEMDALYGVSERANMAVISDSLWSHLKMGNSPF